MQPGERWGFAQRPTREVTSLDPHLRKLVDEAKKQLPADTYRKRENLAALCFRPGR